MAGDVSGRRYESTSVLSETARELSSVLQYSIIWYQLVYPYAEDRPGRPEWFLLLFLRPSAGSTYTAQRTHANKETAGNSLSTTDVLTSCRVWLRSLLTFRT